MGPVVIWYGWALAALAVAAIIGGAVVGLVLWRREQRALDAAAGARAGAAEAEGTSVFLRGVRRAEDMEAQDLADELDRKLRKESER